MGAHHNQQIHRRAAAAKQRRLATDEADEALLKSLIARFSPTAIYTETETSPPITTDTPTDTPTTTPPPPPPPPTTTPPAPPTTPTTTPPTNTDTTPPPAQQTTTNPPPAGQQTTANTNPNTNVVTTPPVVNTLPVTTPPTRTLLTTQAPASVTSSASSSTPSSESGTNVGGIVGGIAGALLGLGVLIFVVRFIMNRQRRKHDEDSAATFNANDFRRSAVLMNDPPTHDETVERGFNPRPPTMIQRRLASPAPTFGTQYGVPGPYGATGGTEYGNMDQYGQYQSYGPSQVMNNMSPLVSATSAHPMYPNAAYGQSPFSPIGSPVSATGPGYDGGQSAILTRQPSSATQLSRQPSAGGVNGYPQDDTAQFATYHNQGNLSAPNEYVELDRSSVTPYQAAQYAEISKRLNTDVPAGLDTPAVNQFVRSSNEGAPPVPANDAASPFADPIPAALLAGGGTGAKATRPTSTDSVTRDLDNFPAPPSPAHNSRVDSSPPMLPEILVESRVASYDFPASVRASPIGSGYPSGVTKDFIKSPLGSQFPATPSPMASSFDITSPPAAATSFPAAAPAPAAEVKADQKKRPDTLYDDDDAYGGM